MARTALGSHFSILMYWIRYRDFAMLYRALNNYHPSDVQAAREFRERNPECPQLVNAETFEKACEINSHRFFLVKY